MQLFISGKGFIIVHLFYVFSFVENKRRTTEVHMLQQSFMRPEPSGISFSNVNNY